MKNKDTVTTVGIERSSKNSPKELDLERRQFEIKYWCEMRLGL